ncbi:conserved hypothetical protein [Sporisorium reilianum SRZ2]|uniref:Uncharacterized protein n=1 Tax=Sporisorium reilianum (strain SRZ2) TaxID=999809 RepID=E6ZQI2_SPORE|nr:conserved hypothetical protein [Sporisorium reilianum SRZ2]
MSWIVPTAQAARPGGSALARPRRALIPACCSSSSRLPIQVAPAGIPSRSSISTNARDGEPDHLRRRTSKLNSAVQTNTAKQQRTRKASPQPALLRLDPKHPILPSLTLASSRDGGGAQGGLNQRRAKRLSSLHVALQTGSADAVWSAYLDLRQNHGADENYSFTYNSASSSVLTPDEFRSVVKVVSNEAMRTKRGLNRILKLMSDIRSEQRRLLTQLQHASDANDAARGRMLKSELEDWDHVVSPKLLNATISHIGRSLRSVGLDEIDQVLDQLLTYEANEQCRRNASRHEQTSSKHISPLYSAGPLDHLRTAILSPTVRIALSKKRGKQRQPDFPDLATYNTILDVITRTVHRSATNRRSASEPAQAYDEEEDDMMAKFSEQQRESHSAELHTSIATKLRRFDLDADSVPLHADAFERADRLFHSVLDRMQRKSGIEPDAITFNIMVTMYCLLDRWEMVHRVVRIASEQGALQIDCINNALGHWLVRGPASTSAARRDHTLEADAVDSAVEVYRQLRQNLVHAELASRHSSISYGRRGADAHDTSGTGNESESAHNDALGPLSWPDREDVPSARSASSSSMAAKSDAVEAILGIPRLPLDAMPDEITHSLMISSLTREGRFADALSVFKDLVSTPVRRVSRDADAKPNGTEAGESKMRPTLAIFDSFFRGFSRHGRPSRATRFDAQDPESSTWELVTSSEPSEADEGPASEAQHAQQPSSDSPHAQQLQMWRIETFQEIFDAFLHFEPDVSQVLGQGQRASGGEAGVSSQRAGERRISTRFGWLTLAEKRRLDALRRAPSTNQLFWILTAIRRVSHDHAGWSLAMWHKVTDKFDADPRSSSSSAMLAWRGFRLDNRLHRVLDHLSARLSQEPDADADTDADERAVTQDDE